MLRRETYRLFFPLGALLAWVGVLPWLFFALRLRRIYEPLNSVLAYRSFLHPLAELEGFLTCFAVGVLFTVLSPPPSAWQIGIAIAAPIASAALAAVGRWQLAQAVWLALLALVLEFSLRRARRPDPASLLWIAAGLLMGAAGTALAEAARIDGWEWLSELGRDLVMQGMFAGLAVGLGRLLREDERSRWPLHALGAGLVIASFWVGALFRPHLGFALRALVLIAVARPLLPPWEFGPRNLRRGFAHWALWLLAAGNAWIAIAPQVRRAGLHVVFLGCFACLLFAGFTKVRPLPTRLAAASALLALSMLGRVMVELDPTSFHLWMGISSTSFLAGSVVCALVPARAQSV